MSFQENYILLGVKEIGYSFVRRGVCYQRLKTSKRIIKHNNLKFQRGGERASVDLMKRAREAMWLKLSQISWKSILFTVYLS